MDKSQRFQIFEAGFAHAQTGVGGQSLAKGSQRHFVFRKVVMGSDSLDKRLPGTRELLTNEYQSLYSTPVALFFGCREQCAKDASAPVVRMNHAGQFFFQDTVAIHIQ